MEPDLKHLPFYKGRNLRSEILSLFAQITQKNKNTKSSFIDSAQLLLIIPSNVNFVQHTFHLQVGVEL